MLALVFLVAALAGAAEKPKLWSLEPVVRPAVPAGYANPIDAFVAAKHKQRGLTPVAAADRLALLRRVHFDLIGLPPSPADQDAFLADSAPDAYEKAIDRLLNDQQHGVRWARHWLDVLRYADLDGLDGSVMPAAPGIYLWRDWVIAALNDDMPYDQFVRAQILGNRYRALTSMSATGRRRRVEPNPQDQFALGFLARAALTGNNRDQDIAIAAVETISAAFMGLTVACAKCHDHRYDPITRTEYYSMKALFDPLVLRKTVLATPSEIRANGLEVEAYRRKLAPVEEAVEKLVAPYRDKLYEERVALLPAEVQAVIRKPERKRTPEEQKIADDYFPVLRIDPPKIKEIMPKDEIARYDALLKQQREIRRPADLTAHWTVEESPVLLREKTYILTSGDPARPEKDKPVEPGFPLRPADADFRDGRREGFVDWLTAAENPLFARVAVNRIWQWHFGEPLHKTPSDFGTLGGKPANQPLLDYLAAEFVAHDYSMKWLHRLILTSETYRRSSKFDARAAAANLKADPGNAYLWHFPLQRLEAEPLWDSLLSVSGQLDLSVGGKSFQTVQADNKQSIFLPREGTLAAKANRRGIYMARGYIPSTDVMAHFLETFDVDDGRTPCPLRTRTITAPQALFAMNDEMVDAASAELARIVMSESGGDLRAAAQASFKRAIGRPATPAELDRALSYLAGDAARMKGLEWLLFNLDEFLFVR